MAAARNNAEQSAHEAMHVGWDFRDRVQERDLDELLRATKFPIYLPVGIDHRLLFAGYTTGGGIGGREKLQYHVNTVMVTFVGPIYPEPSENLTVTNEHSAQHWQPASRIAAEALLNAAMALRSQTEAWFHGVYNRSDDMRNLFRTVASLTPTQFPCDFRSGEKAIWEMRRLNSPLRFAHAIAEISDTRVHVGASGTAADDIEDLLQTISKVLPGSREAKELERGRQEHANYLNELHRKKRGGQSEN